MLAKLKLISNPLNHPNYQNKPCPGRCTVMLTRILKSSAVEGQGFLEKHIHTLWIHTFILIFLFQSLSLNISRIGVTPCSTSTSRGLDTNSARENWDPCEEVTGYDSTWELYAGEIFAVIGFETRNFACKLTTPMWVWREKPVFSHLRARVCVFRKSQRAEV
jgi:hypothetical protein